MHTRSIFTALLTLAAAACKAERTPASSGDTTTPVASAQPAPPPADTTSTPPLADAEWTVTADGIGALRVGMTAEDLRRVGGDFTKPGTSSCVYVRPSRLPAGVMVMLGNGVVARVDVDSTGVRTDAGIGVGDAADKVNAAYGDRVTATPHKYVQGGQYLSVRPTSPSDSNRRIVFETENGRVARFRSGRLPEVEWVERCG